VQTETFAPILYVMPFKTLDEAIEMQNDVPQGCRRRSSPTTCVGRAVPVGGRFGLRHRQRQHRHLGCGNRRRVRRREGNRRRSRVRLGRLEGLHAPPDQHHQLFRLACRWPKGIKAFDTCTVLADDSVDIVSVAQAFHWFDPAATRREFHRILRPSGLAAIYWNSRRLTGTPFLIGYEALLQNYGTDYTSVAERYGDEPRMREWFGEGLRGSAEFDHCQLLDFDALRGRLMSSSYAPKPDHPNHEPMMAALRKLFDECAVNGRISFDYDTRVYVGEVL
jgi:SAM-dependent methyltransferase